MSVATLLLRASVPAEDKARTNPLGGDPADIAAGQDIFRQKCEVCHAYDGSGKTEIGAGEYPRPPALRSLVASMTDGEIFYHIRNGIRNTGMPAWSMPEGQIWQLVLYIRNLPITVPMSRQSSVNGVPVHGAIFARAACHGRADRTGFGLALRGVDGMQVVPRRHL